MGLKAGVYLSMSMMVLAGASTTLLIKFQVSQALKRSLHQPSKPALKVTPHLIRIYNASGIARPKIHPNVNISSSRSGKQTRCSQAKRDAGS